MATLTKEDLGRALRRALAQSVDDLERSKEPWFRHDPLRELRRGSLPPGPGIKVTGPDSLKRMIASAAISGAQNAIQRRAYQSVEPRAYEVLAAVGIAKPDPSPEFDQLCEDLLKLRALWHQVEIDRLSGDVESDRRYLAPYGRRGLLGGPSSIQTPTDIPAVEAPLLSQAWAEYVQEKTAVMGKARWKEKTTVSQQVTYDEFLEITGDVPLTSITRATMGWAARKESLEAAEGFSDPNPNGGWGWVDGGGNVWVPVRRSSRHSRPKLARSSGTQAMSRITKAIRHLMRSAPETASPRASGSQDRANREHWKQAIERLFRAYIHASSVYLRRSQACLVRLRPADRDIIERAFVIQELAAERTEMRFNHLLNTHEASADLWTTFDDISSIWNRIHSGWLGEEEGALLGGSSEYARVVAEHSRLHQSFNPQRLDNLFEAAQQDRGYRAAHSAVQDEQELLNAELGRRRKAPW